MNDIDRQIANLKKRLQQKKELKRQKEARERAKTQSELDRCNLLLGRALAQTGSSDYLQSLRGLLGQRRSQMSDLSDKDYQKLMEYFEKLIGSRS